jgi:hypothetical protein
MNVADGCLKFVKTASVLILIQDSLFCFQFGAVGTAQLYKQRNKIYTKQNKSLFVIPNRSHVTRKLQLYAARCFFHQKFSARAPSYYVTFSYIAPTFMVVKDQNGLRRFIMMYKFAWSKYWCSNTVHDSQ